ncbi:MAG: hypothetical protein PHU23_02185 [Dehalococcoidales bacterium]|nr:hypothetical protein [Dehalococcoidales bacterium]
MDFDEMERKLSRYIIPDSEETATTENITQLTGALLELHEVNGDKWEHLREALYQFCLKEIDYGSPEGLCTVSQMVPRIWGFYHGFMASEEHGVKLLDEMIERLKAGNV